MAIIYFILFIFVIKKKIISKRARNQTSGTRSLGIYLVIHSKPIIDSSLHVCSLSKATTNLSGLTIHQSQ
jgi:hypothetical protein